TRACWCGPLAELRVLGLSVEDDMTVVNMTAVGAVGREARFASPCPCPSAPSLALTPAPAPAAPRRYARGCCGCTPPPRATAPSHRPGRSEVGFAAEDLNSTLTYMGTAGFQGWKALVNLLRFIKRAERGDASASGFGSGGFGKYDT